ncbi:Type 1 glutamine amidotransferase-like domain-containing protein [Pseudarthrobacter sp. R1]|uniref:Type 1 glutamine amidotransferase-like domain-containing protein n=1 Tax=Pseudarthrobacter sp. R1 TaxID=2944934 RepID=UPI0021089C74|nr:Type 1 glutamine amidotransferase-like domain-containing protein [Pseudarthrobacter sp. R1]MCQ6272970.1 Type 1 glutamine amidotransferase-like domain-containing protein [Pseudarthrobacter sp. R1]
MGIFLAGAGPDYHSFPEVFERFIKNIPGRRGQLRRIAVVVHHRGGNPESVLQDYAGPLQSLTSCEVVPVLLHAGSPADPAVFDNADAVVVGGGLTPAYLEGLRDCAGAIAARVADGAPYLGFSAGAMVAPRRGIIGGYRIGGVEVCGEECSEDLDEVDVRDGLGLVPFSVDVHAAQAGTLSRAVGAVTAGLVDRAVAVDENTAVLLPSVGDAEFDVIGRGNCWDVRSAGTGCSVSVRSKGN